MTGTAHHPEPQPTPDVTADVLNTSHLTPRRAARAHALAGVVHWYNAIADDLVALLDHHGIHGDRRVIVFTAGIDDTPQDQEMPFTDALRSAQLVGLAAETTLVPGDDPTWADAVDLWIDLIDCLSTFAGDQVSPGIVLDLDTRTIGGWNPYYCPDHGNHPESIQVMPTLDELNAETDPFAQLLGNDPEARLDDAVDALLSVMELHELEPPSTPAHDEGDCDLDD